MVATIMASLAVAIISLILVFNRKPTGGYDPGGFLLLALAVLGLFSTVILGCVWLLLPLGANVVVGFILLILVILTFALKVIF